MCSSSSDTTAGTFGKIDIHTHILPKDLPDFSRKFGYKGFIQLDRSPRGSARLMQDGKLFREVGASLWDCDFRLSECDTQGVSIQILSTVPVMFSYWAKPQDALEVSMYLNDHIADTVKEYPKRFIGLGTVPLQDSGLAIQELRRCIKELGLPGVEIGTHVNKWNLDQKELYPFFEAADKLGGALFVHPWDMIGMDRMSKYWLPWLVGMPMETAIAICSMIFGGIFERLPKLRVLFSHGGGAFPSIIGRIEKGFQVRPDLCAVDNNEPPSKYLGKFFVDSIVHDHRALRYILDLFGEDHIILGSDYPFPLGEEQPGKTIASLSDLSGITLNKLFRLNALKWLQIELSASNT